MAKQGNGKVGRGSNGDGNIRQRADGRWEVRVSLPEGGGSKSYYAKTKGEANAKLRAALHTLDMGAPLIRNERLTVARYLEDWLERKRPDLRPNTHDRYRELLAHVSRTLGKLPLTKITPTRLERLYADLMAPMSAETPNGAGLSSTTVHHVHTVLRQALADAQRHGLVARNVAERRSGAHPPRMRQTEMGVLTLAQAQALLTAAQDDRLEALYRLAITTGMREGELLALRWRDVDLEAAYLQVRGTLSRRTGEGFSIGQPKTTQARRRIDLDDKDIAALRRHKARQAQERLASGLGAAWGDKRWPDLVFTSEVGGPLDGRNLRRRGFARLLKHAGLPAIRFHDLRHTAVSLMLLQGTSPKVVSERVGHASPAFTMARYSHVLPGMQRDAAEALGRALFGG